MQCMQYIPDVYVATRYLYYSRFYALYAVYSWYQCNGDLFLCLMYYFVVMWNFYCAVFVIVILRCLLA